MINTFIEGFKAPFKLLRALVLVIYYVVIGKVTMRNLGRALHDQGPIKRFAKNVWRGNVFGLFHIRSHQRDNGNLKVMYNTKVTVVKSAEAMMKKNPGTYFSNYKCMFCDGYHLGRNRAPT